MKAVILALSVIFLVGCNTQPIKTIDDQAVLYTEKPLNQEALGKYIKAAAIHRGWKPKQIEPGHIVAEIRPRNKHFVAIDIFYDNDSYSIHYKDSANMKYQADNNTIHKNYNRWIANLTQAIDSVIYKNENDVIGGGGAVVNINL